MKPNQIHKVLDLAFSAREQGNIVNPCFVGPPGLGKTEIIQQYCRENQLKNITLTSALLEPPDIRGFPSIEVKDGRQVLSFVPPEFWPVSGKGIIILEEVNRGTTSVMNAWMALTDGRRGFDNYTLPEGWIVVAAINPEDANYDVNTMDSALKDRFEFFEVHFDKPSFIQYMRDQNWDTMVRMYVEGVWEYKRPEEVSTTVGNKYLSPRGYSKLNAVRLAVPHPEIEQLTYDSILGANHGKGFYAFVHNDQPVLYSDLVKDTKASLKKLKKFSNVDNYKAGHLSLTIQSIVEDGSISDDLLKDVFLSMNADQGLKLFKELEIKRGDFTISNRLCDRYKEVKTLIKDNLKVTKKS